MKSLPNNLNDYLAVIRRDESVFQIGSIRDTWHNAAMDLVQMGGASWMSEDILAIQPNAEILCKPKLTPSTDPTDSSQTSGNATSSSVT